MNNYKSLIPLLFALIFSAGSFALNLESDDMTLVRDLAIADLRSREPIKKQISWGTVVAEFRERNQARCKGLSDKILIDKISIKFANTFQASHGPRHAEWEELKSAKAKPAKRDKEVEKKLEKKAEAPKPSPPKKLKVASDDKAAKPSPFDLTKEHLDALLPIAIAYLTEGDPPPKRLDWAELTQMFKAKYPKLCRDIDDNRIEAKLKTKFKIAFVNGNRKDEWIALRLKHGLDVRATVSKKRVIDEEVEEEAPPAKPAPAKKRVPLKAAAAVSVLSPLAPLVALAPVSSGQDAKKPDSLILQVLASSSDDKFMAVYGIAYNAKQNCVNCVRDGEETPVLLAVLKAKRFDLFKRLIRHEASQTALDLPFADEKTLREILVDYVRANKLDDLLKDLRDDRKAMTRLTDAFVRGEISLADYKAKMPPEKFATFVKQRFVAAVNSTNEVELAFWFASGLIDWSTEIVM